MFQVDIMYDTLLYYNVFYPLASQIEYFVEQNLQITRVVEMRMTLHRVLKYFLWTVLILARSLVSMNSVKRNYKNIDHLKYFCRCILIILFRLLLDLLLQSNDHVSQLNLYFLKYYHFEILSTLQ